MQKLKQKGAALILIAFIIGLAASAYLLYALNPERLRAEQDKKAMITLAQVKEAIISYSVSRSGAGERPGDMPRPDYFASTESPADYDGTSETGCIDATKSNGLPLKSGGANMRCLGRLPWKTIGMDVGEITQNDTLGNMPWYAVSANLVDPVCLDVLNPSILNKPFAGYVCSSSTLPHPWLKVRDSLGNVLSNRVAVVLMMPRTTLGTQVRPVAPLRGVASYLDSLSVPAGCTMPCVPGNHSNADFNDDFILTSNPSNIATTNNDNLVYITIDELIYALEKRVLQETKYALNKFNTAKGYYPFAAGLGSSANPNQCTQGNLRGLLPVNAPATHLCSCNSSGSGGICICNFDVVTRVSFTRKSGDFATTGVGAPTGACLVSLNGKTCACNGAGRCNRNSGTFDFQCDACGQCTSTVEGTNTFTTTGDFTNAPTGSCSISSNSHQADCQNDENGTFTLKACNSNEHIKSLPTAGGLLPAWFTANQWEKYIVYAVSDNCVSSGSNCTSTPQITVGVNPAVRSLVAASVINPNGSCDISSYLSSTENTNVVVSNGLQDTNYQITQPKTQSNSDQLVLVAP
jgi:hypothetical protein